MFAVFDGHGGAEVALYCAYKIPLHLKNVESYKNGDYEKALVDTFLGVDDTLLDEAVIQKMKRMVPDEKPPSETESDRDEDEEDLRQLCREGKMPLSELLANIHGQNPLNDIQKDGESSGSSSGARSLGQILREQCAKWSLGTESGSDSSDDDDVKESDLKRKPTSQKVIRAYDRNNVHYLALIFQFCCLKRLRRHHRRQAPDKERHRRKKRSK